MPQLGLIQILMVIKCLVLDEAPQLYSLAYENTLKINVLPEINSGLIIPIGLQVGADTEYTIVAKNIDSFSKGVSLYLEDLQEKVMIDLSLQTDYTFLASPEDDPARFMLHFSTVGIEEKQILDSNNDYSIYSSENSVYIKNNTKLQTHGDVFVYNIMGQEVYQTGLQNIKLNRIDLYQETGYYIVKVVSSEGVYSEKVFIR